MHIARVILLVVVLLPGQPGQGFQLRSGARAPQQPTANRRRGNGFRCRHDSSSSGQSLDLSQPWRLPSARAAQGNNGHHTSNDCNNKNNNHSNNNNHRVQERMLTENGLVTSTRHSVTRREAANTLLVRAGASTGALSLAAAQEAAAADVKRPPFSVLLAQDISLPLHGIHEKSAVESIGPRSEVVEIGRDGPLISAGRDETIVSLPPIGSRVKRILLVRHGQTDFNLLKVCQGRRLNPPLNANGRSQARRLLVGTGVDAIVCSPMRRARETAGIVRESHPSTPLTVSVDLNEVNFGDAEGLPLPLAAAVLTPAYLAWSSGRLGVRAGRSGENGRDLRRRVGVAAELLLGKCEEGGQVLAVSHSSMIKFMLATLLDVPLATVRTLGQDNCSVNAVDFDVASGVFDAVVINGRRVRGRAARFTRVV